MNTISYYNLKKIVFFIKGYPFYKELKIGAFIRKPIKVSGKKYIILGKSSIEKNARIEAVIKYKNKIFQPQIIIEDSVAIGQNLHLTCAEKVVISKGVSITPNVGIFDIVHPYLDISINPRLQEIKTSPVFIGENCLIGMNSVLLPGTRLGRHCIVGALSLCSGEFPDYSLIAGAPAKIIKRYNFETQQWEKTTPDGSFINSDK